MKLAWSRRSRRRAAVLLLVAACGLGAFAAAATGDSDPSSLVLTARSAILIDQATGRILFQRDADRPMVPASLAKLMSLHIVYEKLASRSISKDDVVMISSNALARNQTAGSTLMFLEPGQIVTVGDLMKGVAVASGNDAATALAEYVAGSTENFVEMMNEEARWLGLRATRFEDPSGYSTRNAVTAREFASFCRRYIEVHPQALPELHSLREFDYPLPRNEPSGVLVSGQTRKTYNGNYLVWDNFGVDGLKTGHLDDRNFTAAITAKRGDTRLIAVLLGVPGRDMADGARNRAQDGMALLAYGFRNFATVELEAPSISPARVWKGITREVSVRVADTPRVTVRPEEIDSLAYSVVTSVPIVAPVLKGQKVGDLVFSSGETEVARINLVAAESVEPAGFFRRVWDTVVLGLSTLAGVLSW